MKTLLSKYLIAILFLGLLGGGISYGIWYAHRYHKISLSFVQIIPTKQGDNLLLHYNYFTSKRGSSTTHHRIKTINLETGETMGTIENSFGYSGRFKILYQDANLLYVHNKKDYEVYETPSLNRLYSQAEIEHQIQQTNPQIKEIHKLSFIDGIFQVATNQGFKYPIKLSDWTIIDDTTKLELQQAYNAEYQNLKYRYANRIFAKNKTAYQQATKSITQCFQKKNTYNFERTILENYTVVGLTGDLRRTFIQIDSVCNINIPNAEAIFLKGELLRPHHERQRNITELTSIQLKYPTSLLIKHKSEMNAETAINLLSRVDLNGRIVSQYPLKDWGVEQDVLAYTFVRDNYYFFVFKGKKYNGKLIALDMKSNQRLWEKEFY